MAQRSSLTTPRNRYAQHNPATPDAFGLPTHHPIFGSAPSPSRGRLAGVKNGGRVACRRRRVLGCVSPWVSLAPGPDLEGSRTVALSTPIRISVPLTEAPGRPALLERKRLEDKGSAARSGGDPGRRARAAGGAGSRDRRGQSGGQGVRAATGARRAAGQPGVGR